MDLESAEVLTLRTFGTLTVVDGDGQPVRAMATQRRLLAFLSALAAAGESGLSRDRVAVLLWPDSTSERAGQSVTQAMYSARRLLHIDDLFITGGDLRLNPARMMSDVAEFETAFARADWSTVVSTYRGAFLDGFFLSAAPEFEQWASGLRRRYEDQYVRALRALADSAASDGNAPVSLDWWKRLAAVRPLDAAIAVSLMNALAATGDRAGAMRHAQVHTELLRQEFELEPDPVVLANAERLRNAGSWSGSSNSIGALATRDALSTSINADPTPEARGHSTVATQSKVGRVRQVLINRTLVGSWLVGSMLTPAIVGAAYLVAHRRVSRASNSESQRGRERIVVAPFRVSGASASLAYLRDGLVELLSERLSDDSTTRSVDAGTSLNAWRQVGISDNVDLPRDSIVHLASTIGANRVVIGSVVGTPAHVVLSATVVRVEDGSLTTVASAQGSADSVNVLVDRLAADLLVQEAGEDAALAGQILRPLPALRAFLSGEAAFRRGSYEEALRAYSNAIGRDSTFALAALRIVRAGDRLQAIATRGAPLDLAWKGRNQLPNRERVLLEALAGPKYPRPASNAEQLAAWERMVALDPDRADAWYELGARLFHAGVAIGLPDARSRSAIALQRALSLDSSYVPAQRLLVQLAAIDSAGRLPLPSSDLLRRSAGPLASSENWRVAIARNDSSTLSSLRDTMASLGPANLRVIAQLSQFDVIGLDDGRRALEILRNRPARPSERLEQADAQHSLAILQGRLRDATAAADRLSELQPGTAAGLRLQVLDALYGDGDDNVAESAVRELAVEEIDGTTTPTRIPGRMADICVIGQWRATHGDATGLRRDLRLLDAAIDERDGARGSTAASLIGATPPSACALLLDASLALMEHRVDARRTLARLDSTALIPPVAGDASIYAPIILARLHAKLGDVAGALDAVRRRVYLMGWPRYLATALREEALYAELLGDHAKERSALERFVTLRQSGDSSLASQAVAARQRLRELGP